MEAIKSLANTSFDILFRAFNEAFKDYEMQLDSHELRTMLHRRGFDPALSFGAFDGQRLVAFTFNGIGSFDGKRTAYDTGTGTLEEYRGKGLASRIFQHSIPYLKKAGVRQYLLEVLQHNEKAVSVYLKAGFEVSREFNYFVAEKEQIRIDPMQGTPRFQVKEIDLIEAEALKEARDFSPSWQNSFEAIRRKPEDFIVLGAFDGTQFVGYAILEPASGDLTQLAVMPAYRRKGAGTLLTSEILGHNRHSGVKFINTAVECQSMTRFLESISMPVTGRQFEMIRSI